jgi:hypothetical protein
LIVAKFAMHANAELALQRTHGTLKFFSDLAVGTQKLEPTVDVRHRADRNKPSTRTLGQTVLHRCAPLNVALSLRIKRRFVVRSILRRRITALFCRTAFIFARRLAEHRRLIAAREFVLRRTGVFPTLSRTPIVSRIAYRAGAALVGCGFTQSITR